MKLSQLAAEAAARLADLRHKQGLDADAECFVSFISRSQIVGDHDERDVEAVELFLGNAVTNKWYFEIKTEKEQGE